MVVKVQLLTETTFSGAFTPSCSARHLPGYIQKLPEIKSKGVDIVAVIAYNDAFVLSAWGKANNVKGDDIVRSRSRRSCTELIISRLLVVLVRRRSCIFEEDWLDQGRAWWPICYHY